MKREKLLKACFSSFLTLTLAAGIITASAGSVAALPNLTPCPAAECVQGTSVFQLQGECTHPGQSCNIYYDTCFSTYCYSCSF